MVVTRRISFSTKGRCDLIDITREVAREVASSSVNAGTVTVFVTGSTAGVSTIEFEGGLLGDFEDMWQRLVPANLPYQHDRAWGDGNGYSHVRASLLGSSLTIPFVDGRLLLGTWQQIIVADFDNRARSREIVLQIMGE